MTTNLDPGVTAESLARLRAALDAVVATAGEEAYDREVSTWNCAVALRPAVVVGARTPDDVVAAVGWAAELGLPIGVNATGHGAVANAAGALLINTSRMSAVTVDAATATATVGAGARVRDVTAAAAAHGLACIQGSSSSVGAAGFMLGGGLGVLSRTFGLAVDHVLSIDVVTADGQLRTIGLDDVVRTRMFVTDITRWDEIGRAHSEFFATIRPAASMIEVRALVDPRLLIEIEADAVMTDHPRQ